MESVCVGNGTAGSNPALSAIPSWPSRAEMRADYLGNGAPDLGLARRRWNRFEPGQAGNGAALRTGSHASRERVRYRARASANFTSRMTYVVLARKYRPRVFADVVGQEVATGTLKGAIEEGRVGHAYLFCGPRGTGKTTIARIFAKALNCELNSEKTPRADPCGTCERCRAADEGSDVDLVEIDAASNRGIDDIRGLRESASYRPMRARFKIYIVDEAHMLTKEAVNAFLKTLEEPPPHVKLFFATTEPEKLLPTFVSRCQIVRLALLSEDAIAGRLAQVFTAEGIRAGEGVTPELARRSRGGLRDALSLADQLVSLVGDAPVLADLDRLGGGAGRREIEELLHRIESGDRAATLLALPEAEGSERELLLGLLANLRRTLLAGFAGDHPLVDADAEELAAMRARFERLGADRIEVWMAELLRARERIELLKAVPPRLILEATLLDLCRAEASIPLMEIAERLLALEARLGSGGPVQASSPARPTASAHSTAPAPQVAAQIPLPRAGEKPVPAREPSLGDLWQKLVAKLESEARSMGEILRARGKLESCSGGRATIRLTGLRPDEQALVGEARNARKVSAAATELLGEACEVRLEVAGSASTVPARSADLFTQKIVDSFGGRIVEET